MNIIQDYVGFMLGDYHSIKDFGIYRTSTSKRYADSFSPVMNDTKQSITGAEGSQFVRSQYKERSFTINYAFDSMTEQQVHDWRRLCSSKEMMGLVFDEAPYKQWDVKITGTPNFKVLQFVEDGENIYKGEGTIQVMAFYPFAHNPDKVWRYSNSAWTYTTLNRDIMIGSDSSLGEKTYMDAASGQKYYVNLDRWKVGAGLKSNSYGSTLNDGHNYGDIPAPFKVDLGNISGLTVGNDYNIAVQWSEDGNTFTDLYKVAFKAEATSYNHILWNSETGLITHESSGNLIILPYVGIGCCTIPVTTGNQKFRFTILDAPVTPTHLYMYQWYY